MPSECCQLKFKNPLHQKRKLKNDSLFRKKVENNFETLWKPEKIELNISPDFEEKQKQGKTETENEDDEELERTHTF